MTIPRVSAYVPCFNNRRTLRRAVECLLAQTITLAEVLVIDDGSTDGSIETLGGLNVRVIRHDQNLGRGAARARAMQEARHDLVLCCDTTHELEVSFVERVLPWFADRRVAAVFGKLTQPVTNTATDRWRGRHLFKLDAVHEIRHGAALSTGRTLVRASAVRAVGGYDPALRHSEDADLGERLLWANFDVIYDPRAEVATLVSNSVLQVLERYWRWYAGQQLMSWRGYVRNLSYSVKEMAMADLRARDVASAGISMLCPHYQFWMPRVRRRSAARRLRRQAA